MTDDLEEPAKAIANKVVPYPTIESLTASDCFWVSYGDEYVELARACLRASPLLRDMAKALEIDLHGSSTISRKHELLARYASLTAPATEDRP